MTHKKIEQRHVLTRSNEPQPRTVFMSTRIKILPRDNIKRYSSVFGEKTKSRSYTYVLKFIQIKNLKNE